MDVQFIKLNEFVEIPKFHVSNDEDYVKYGDNNNQPDKLLEYYKSVGLHRRIISQKIDMFMGKGITFDDTGDAISKRTAEFLNNINPFETIDQLFNKIATDVFLFGGVYLQMSWTGKTKKIGHIYQKPFNKMRMGPPNKYGFSEKYYFNNSNDKHEQWETYTDISEPYIEEFQAFNTDNRTGNQILYIKKHDPENQFYALPTYSGCIKELDTMAAISDFNNSAIHNGMQPGLTIFFTGPTPSKEKQDAIAKKFKEKHVDTKNAGRTMLLWTGQNEADLKQLETSDIADMYEKLTEQVEKTIILSENINRAALGLTSASLGNSKEQIDATELLLLYHIEPIRDYILKLFNGLMVNNGLKEISIINPNRSLVGIDIDDMEKFLTKDEIREYFGREEYVEEIKEENLEELEEKSQAELRGSKDGVSSILEIQQSITDGVINISSAISMLENLYGYDEETARNILGLSQPVEPEIEMKEEKKNFWKRLKK